MSDPTMTAGERRPFGLPRWLAAVLPLVLLAVVVAGLLLTAPFASLAGGEPLPDVSITHSTLPNDETVVLHAVNNGPDPVTVSQVLVNDAYWSFSVAGGDGTLAPMESARIEIPYHWQPTWDIHTTLVLSSGATFGHTIVSPAVTPGLTLELLGLLAVVGLFVGVIPVVIGMAWLPFIRGLSGRQLGGVLAFSAGVLGFLAIDAGFEAFELAEQVPGAFEGPALVALAVLGALLAVQSISAWREERAAAGDERASDGLYVAYLVAIGIGLHNLAEGLAIGSSFALGRVSLGAFLVIGFAVHNVTEGPAVVAPIARGERPPWKHFVALGLVAGAPVILGGWIGSLAYSPTIGALFLAVGVGAILQVTWELRGVIDRAGGGGSLAVLAFLAGLVVMYATDLLVVL